MQASNIPLADHGKGGKPGLVKLITASKLLPLQQDNRPKNIELHSAGTGFDDAYRKEPNLDLAGPPEIPAQSGEFPAESIHDRRLRYIEEHYKNGLLEQKLEAMKAMLSDMTRQRDSWQAQAERSLASFHDAQRELMQFVRQTPDSRVAKRNGGFLGFFRSSA
jgi:hypothetical protein